VEVARSGSVRVFMRVGMGVGLLDGDSRLAFM
jgi:hypothetical protein